MGYVDTKVVIIYCKLDQPHYIPRSHRAWFDEYNSCLYTEDKYNPRFLILQ